MGVSTVKVSNCSNGDGPSSQFATIAIHAGAPVDQVSGAVIEPISLSTTFAFTAVDQPIGYTYTRSGNPNRRNLEIAIAALEKARYALTFSSGLAATAIIVQSLSPGSHVISMADVYGGTHQYFSEVARGHGIEVTFTREIGVQISDLMRPNTKLIWIESPSNPGISLVDIRSVAIVAHQHGALLAVDNTFLSPYIQNPLQHGADIVLHSVTKYINGHSDVWAVPSPFDCWLAHRGLKTLHLRAREVSKNAGIIAKFLEASPHVMVVNYPGLKSHPQHAIVLKQHRNGMGGGMLSFRLKAGKTAAATFCHSLRVFTLAVSLGGVESLAEIPSLMTHKMIPQSEREAGGMFDDLVRLSCGIEDAVDLVDDVTQALEKAVNIQSS